MERRHRTMKRARVPALLLFPLFLIAVVAAPAGAVAPRLLSYQGFLTYPSGQPIDTTVTIRFALYDVASGGVEKWGESFPNLTVAKGIVNATLGLTNPVPDAALAPAEVYLGIRVGADAEMTPRLRVASAAFAIEAVHADDASTVGGQPPADFEAAGTAAQKVGDHEANNFHPGDQGAFDAYVDARITSGSVPDNSVTSLKIQDGTITDVDISDMAGIRASKIDRSGLDADLLDGIDGSVFIRRTETEAVTSALIQDLTITNADISNAANISATKINRTNLNADQLDGVDASGFVQQGEAGSITGDMLDLQFLVDGNVPGTKGMMYLKNSSADAQAVVGIQGTNDWNINGAVAVVGASSQATGNGVAGFTSQPDGNGLWGGFASGTQPNTNGFAVYANAPTPGWAGYFQGNVKVTGNIDLDGTVIKPGGSDLLGKPVALAIPGSVDQDIYLSGSGRLAGGATRIDFDPAFSRSISEGVPVRVVVTPTSDCRGVFIVAKDAAGFTVQELSGGTSDATFDWMAIGRQKGREVRPVMLEQPDPEILGQKAKLVTGPAPATGE
jgi:hypothetical protein